MRWWVALVLAAGCGSRTELDVTIAVDSSVTDDVLHQIDNLYFQVRGDLKPFNKNIPIGQQLATREARLVYLPGVSSGTLQLDLEAFADYQGNGPVVALAPTQYGVPVEAGRATPVTLTLQALASSSGDMAVGDLADLAGVDLGAPDLTGTGVSCSTGTGLFCENFEQDNVASDLDTVWMGRDPVGGPEFTIVSPGAKGTNHALEVHIANADGGYGQAFMYSNQLISQLPVSVYFYAKRIGAEPQQQTIILTYGPSGDDTDIQTDTGFQVSPFGSSGTTFMNSSIGLDTIFHCYELRFTAMRAELWQDGTLLAWSNNSDTKTFVNSRVQIIVATNDTSPYDFAVVYDELLVSATTGLCP